MGNRAFQFIDGGESEFADRGGRVVKRPSDDRLREAACIGVLDQIQAVEKIRQRHGVVAGHATRRVVDVNGREPALGYFGHRPDSFLWVGREHQDSWRLQIVEQIPDQRGPRWPIVRGALGGDHREEDVARASTDCAVPVLRLAPDLGAVRADPLVVELEDRRQVGRRLVEDLVAVVGVRRVDPTDPARACLRAPLDGRLDQNA